MGTVLSGAVFDEPPDRGDQLSDALIGGFIKRVEPFALGSGLRLRPLPVLFPAVHPLIPAIHLLLHEDLPCQQLLVIAFELFVIVLLDNLKFPLPLGQFFQSLTDTI